MDMGQHGTRNEWMRAQRHDVDQQFAGIDIDDLTALPRLFEEF